jgi:hypothetical protein
MILWPLALGFLCGPVLVAQTNTAAPVEPLKVSLTIRAPTSHLPQPLGRPLQVSSFDYVSLNIKASYKNFDPQSISRLQTSTDNNPYAKPEANNVTINLFAGAGEQIPWDKFTLSLIGGGRGVRGDGYDSDLLLLLKIPTERSDRIARAKVGIEKAFASEKKAITTTGRYTLDKLATALADHLIDSKPGAYTVSVTFKDPKTGISYTSNSAAFEIVYQEYPPQSPKTK